MKDRKKIGRRSWWMAGVLAGVLSLTGDTGPIPSVVALNTSFAADVLLKEMTQDPDRFIDQRITTMGKLKYVGKNYFSDPMSQFVLEDDAGNQVSIAPWLPLEIAPSRPDQLSSDDPRTKVMKDYLGKELRIMGKVRFNKHKAKHEVEEEAIEEVSSP